LRSGEAIVGVSRGKAGPRAHLSRKVPLALVVAVQIPHRHGIHLLELGKLLRLDELFYEHKMGYIVGHEHSTKESLAQVWILASIF